MSNLTRDTITHLEIAQVAVSNAIDDAKGTDFEAQFRDLEDTIYDAIHDLSCVLQAQRSKKPKRLTAEASLTVAVSESRVSAFQFES